MLPVFEHRVGVARAYAQRYRRQRLELDAGADRVRTLESLFEFGLVLFGVGLEAVGCILHADAVVPVAFVVDRNQAEVPEGVGDAEQQARRRGEAPRVAAHIVLIGRTVLIDLCLFGGVVVHL